jgi:hypothetical protein
VPSSTSSSDRRPRNRWLRTLAAGLLLALVLLAAWEASWRQQGFDPSVEDGLEIWAVKRRALEDAKESAMALLGASRMQLDVDPVILREVTGRRAWMLAIDGSSPLPVLADLAADSTFSGLVLCSLLPQWLADGGVDTGRSGKWVRKYHQQKWSSRIEARLAILLQSHFVFRYPGLLPGELWESIREGEVPRPPYAPMRTDRYRPADYRMTDIDELRAARIERQQQIVTTAEPLGSREFEERIGRIEEMVREIEARGGEVVFLRLPSCGEILALEQRTWPRERYWDRFAVATSARSIHFADYPLLSGYDCPDGSHLDRRDAVPFTRALVEVLGLRATGRNQD